MNDQRAAEPAPTLDDDPPGSVRVAFIWLTASAGVMLLLPRQVVSAGICFALSLGTLVVHLVLRRRYRRAGPAAEPAASAPPEAAASADPPQPPASSG